MTISNFHQFGEQINRYLSGPQVAEISTQAKKIGEEVAVKLKSVTDQVFEQTKDFRQEFSAVITKEANNLVEMCNALNEEISKTCRYSTPPRQNQQNARPQQQQQLQRKSVSPQNKPTQTQSIPVVPAPVPVVPAPAPAPKPEPVVQPSAPQEPTDYDEYAFERSVLRQMGFIDDTKNAEVLKRYRGDLNECLNSLCQLLNCNTTGVA